jgi:DNA-binding CsgD family transcriptional regulator
VALREAGPEGLMLERAGELSALATLLDGARRGAGGCAVLEGSAGIGKSRLLAEAAGIAAAAGMTVATARCAQLESDFSFGAALQLFEPSVHGADRRRLFAGAAALAQPLFEAAAPAGERDFSRLHGLHWLAANLAERTPLLIAVDDAHWCDVPTLRFLLYLAQRVDELPIAVVVAVRSGDEGPQRKLTRRLAAHPLAVRLALEPLSAAAVAQLVRGELGDGATDSFCAACWEATGGNPLFVRALVTGVRERGGAVDDDAAPRVPEIGAEALARAVLARIDALPDGARELAQAVAVLGDGVSLGQAAALGGMDEEAAVRPLDALTAAGLLEHVAGVSFAHPIVRGAVESGMDPSQRATAHRRAARLLRGAGADAERVASHVLVGGGGADGWAAEVLREAAARAAARGEEAAAARYLRAVVAGNGASGSQPDLLRQLALAEVRARDPGAAERVTTAVAAAGGPRERAGVAVELGLAQLDAGAHDDAEATFGAGLEGLPADLEIARTLLACRSAASGLGHATAPPASLDPVVERAARGLATAAERLQLGHGALVAALAGRSIDDTRRLGRAALLGPPLDPGRASEMSALTLATVALVVADELDVAEPAVDHALAGARALGRAGGYAAAAHIRAWIHFRRGRLADAIADAESVLDAARYGWEPALPAAHALMALCQLERGDHGAAEAALELPGGEDRWRTTFTWNDYADARGQVRLAAGDPRGALVDFLAVGEALEAIGASHASVVPWRSGAAVASAAVGDHDDARRLADRDIELARAYGAPRALGLTLRTAGRLAGGDRGIDLLREADAVLAGSPARLEQAHAQADLGVALLAAGHRVAARAPLKQALDTADGCGAGALVERVRGELTAAGARPRRPALRGRDALTPRELRLAEMAARGMTNRQIAEALFITTKTVETHLRHAYDKLGISSRVGLSGALGSSS